MAATTRKRRAVKTSFSLLSSRLSKNIKKEKKSQTSNSEPLLMDIHTRVMTYLHPPLTPPPQKKTKKKGRTNKKTALESTQIQLWTRLSSQGRPFSLQLKKFHLWTNKQTKSPKSNSTHDLSTPLSHMVGILWPVQLRQTKVGTEDTYTPQGKNYCLAKLKVQECSSFGSIQGLTAFKSGNTEVWAY